MDINPTTNSCLDVQVSCVKNYFSKDPKDVSLLTWLQSNKYKHVVEQLRATQDKQQRQRFKSWLPAITPAGRFSRVEEKYFLAHSGFIQFDIDAKDNTHITNYNALHKQLRNISNIAYCGLSASGTGWWGLVRIAYPEKHLLHWQYIQQAMQRMGINLDAAPKNICSLRGYSYDANAYFNHKANKLFHYIIPAAPRRETEPLQSGANMRRAQQLVAMLEHLGKDITQGYREWFALGCCFAATFGEAGRNLFHRASGMHPKYHPQEADTQYTQCLKFTIANSSTAGLGYLVNRCKQLGLDVSGRAA